MVNGASFSSGRTKRSKLIGKSEWRSMWMPLPDTEREKRMSTFAMVPAATWSYNASASWFAKLGIASTWVADGSRPGGLYFSLVRDDCAASADDQGCCIAKVARSRVEDTFAERSSKALLRAKHDETESGMRERGEAVISDGSKLKAWPMARETTSEYASIPASSDRLLWLRGSLFRAWP